MTLRITVLGTGYVGTAHAVTMAGAGFSVLGMDIDAEKIAALTSGRVPLFEPGIEDLVNHHRLRGVLQFTTSYREAARFGDVHFLCVPTPQSPDGSADLKPLLGALEGLAPHLTRPALVVGKSTVPVGTATVLGERLAELAGHPAVELAWNPEFLREGHAVVDSLHPDRLVFGVSSAPAAALLREVYRFLLDQGVPLIVTGLETAELIKMAANAFLATKISFINAVAEMCELVSADVVTVAEALGQDPRIGSAHLHPGLGFGGSCLPKDLRSFTAQARALRLTGAASLLTAVDQINDQARNRLVDLVRAECGGTLRGKRIAALGAAFKPDSDDTRDSPALAVAEQLHREGAHVAVFDPRASAQARRACPQLDHGESLLHVCREADLLVHLTDWPQFRDVDPAAVAEVVRARRIVDARNSLDPQKWRAAGWRFTALGRPASDPTISLSGTLLR
ncbi:UDP-glucose dehydrogenase family protein [Saccharopolyspora hattusasensis]|uniref:UDP-glucose dehydrogenase family protein n=1 Tax=Saccharopolyspora hattusasensis TaxID=1128679 RepID=UPI003D985E29